MQDPRDTTPSSVPTARSRVVSSPTADSASGSPPSHLLSRLRVWASRSVPTLLGVGLLAVVVVAGGLVGGGAAATEGDVPMVVHAVATSPVHHETGYDVRRTFVGRVEARRESQLGFELGGLLDGLQVDEGDVVAANALLATLDTELLKTERDTVAARLAGAVAVLDELVAGPRAEVVDAARAAVAAQEARAGRAQADLRRRSQLVGNGTITKSTYDEARFAEEAAVRELAAAKARLRELENGTRKERVAAQRAEVARLRAELERVDVRIRKSTMRAPYAGTVSARFVDEGTVVEPGTPIVQLLETSALEARIGIPGEFLGQLDHDTTHALAIEDQLVRARIRTTRPDRSRRTRTVGVLFQLSNRTAGLHIGDLAEFEMVDRTEERGFWLPISALSESHRGLWACYVAMPLEQPDGEATHRLTRADLELIHQTATRAYVRGGVRDGDLVVTDGIHRFVPNQHVRLAGDSPAATNREPRP